MVGLKLGFDLDHIFEILVYRLRYLLQMVNIMRDTL